MLQGGFVAEVQRLRARGDLRPELPSMRCVGYRQAWEVLDAAAPATPDGTGLAHLRETGIAATRQLAKRQLTWLRSTLVQVRVACDAPEAQSRALEALRALAEA